METPRERKRNVYERRRPSLADPRPPPGKQGDVRRKPRRPRPRKGQRAGGRHLGSGAAHPNPDQHLPPGAAAPPLKLTFAAFSPSSRPRLFPAALSSCRLPRAFPGSRFPQREVWFDGARIDGLPPHRIARLGLVRTFQIPRELKGMTVLENLMLVARQQRGEHLFHAWFSPRTVHREEEAALAKAEEVLRFLELRHLAHEYAGNLSVGQKGMCFVPQNRNVFPRLTVEENLEMGAFVAPSEARERMAAVYELFPPLKEKRRTPAGVLSGGQQQMVA